MKIYTDNLTKNLKKIWLSLRKLQKIRNTVDDVYFWLCALWLYDDAYYKLQNIHGIINDVLDNEDVDEEDIEYLNYFIQNRCEDF